MMKIIPFRALLPRRGLAQRIVCPPYDVMNSAGARKLAAGNSYSFLHVTRAEIDLREDTGEYDESVYNKAKENYEDFKDRAWLEKDGEESYYIYRIEGGGHRQTGVVCGASVDDYATCRIRKHERTRKEKVVDRARYAVSLSAHPEPVLYAFKSSVLVKSLIALHTKGEPILDVADADGNRHMLWRCKASSELGASLRDIPALYIADGHHRSECASVVREIRARGAGGAAFAAHDYFPAVVFPHDELKVYRYSWDGDPKTRPLAGIDMKDIMETADKGAVMPPKSTWFAPKLLSGLFVYEL